MAIPLGYGRLAWIMSGEGLPFGGVTTCGLDVRLVEDTFPGVMSSIGTAAQTTFQAICTNDIRLDRVELKLGPDATGPTYVFESGVTGGGTGDSVPPNTSLLVTEVVGGVSGRLNGRMFWPGFDRANINLNGTVDNIGDYEDVFDDFAAILSTLSVYPVVLTSLPEGPRAVSRYNVSSRAATQRQRLRR